MRNSKLYLTQDISSSAYFARNCDGLFARFKKIGDRWNVYFYKDKYTLYKKTLTEVLTVVEKKFRKWYPTQYGKKLGNTWKTLD